MKSLRCVKTWVIRSSGTDSKVQTNIKKQDHCHWTKKEREKERREREKERTRERERKREREREREREKEREKEREIERINF